MGFPRWRPWLILGIGAVLLTACAETNLAVHAVKRAGGTPEGPPGAADRAVKIGNPYQVNGVWYFPKEEPSYDETGIASWYGEPFHGRPTANGDLYDMNELTAAHKTLPLPSTVQVTNLENGRTMLLKVNDRGPFVNGRIIDVSRRASQLLGFHGQGTAKVRVQVVSDGRRVPAETQLAQLGGSLVPQPRISDEERRAVAAAPQARVESQPLPPPPGIAQAPAVPVSRPLQPAAAPPAPVVVATPAPGVVAMVPVKPTGIFIQAGAFTIKENADRLRSRLAHFGQANVVHAKVDGRLFYRVRLGPIPVAERAESMLERLIAEGNQDARIVVE
jgi:rare lipoprotein A